MNSPPSLLETDGRSLEVSLPFAALSVTKKKVTQSLGYEKSQLPEQFGDIINSVLLRVPELCTIRAGYRIVPMAEKNGRSDGLLVDNVFYTMQPVITSQLRKAQWAAIFIGTIGAAMEDWVSSLFDEKDAVTGYFVDTIASVIAENVAAHLHSYIEKQMLSRSLRVTNRYSPGYCGWPVAEQHLLFASFPPGFCGVRLTDSALMTPKKSVSGIIGIGAAVKKETYFCDRCKNSTCTYRSYLSAQKTKRK